MRMLSALAASAVLLVLLVAVCTGCGKGPPALTADVPLHLEDHLDAATIVGSEVPADVPAPVLTISEHLHNAGYQTALFTSNANAATMSNLDRGCGHATREERGPYVTLDAGTPP